MHIYSSPLEDTLCWTVDRPTSAIFFAFKDVRTSRKTHMNGNTMHCGRLITDQWLALAKITKQKNPSQTHQTKPRPNLSPCLFVYTIPTLVGSYWAMLSAYVFP